MGTVETFEHTADVGLRITGNDLDDLFRTAAEGVFDYIVVNRGEVRQTTRAEVEMSAETPAELLVAWLNDLIYRFPDGAARRRSSKFESGRRSQSSCPDRRRAD